MMDAIVKELREYDTDYPAFELMDKAADAIDSLRARLAKYEDAEGRPFKCQTCQDSGVVSTTDKDHNGDHIEQRCPACAGEAFQCEHAACQSLGEHHPFCEYVTQVSAGGVDERAADVLITAIERIQAEVHKFLKDRHRPVTAHIERICISALAALAVKQARAALAQSERVPEWVPVSERLPDETHAYGCHTNDVLCRTRSGKVIVALLARTTTGDVWYDQQSKERDVTHWMPLPAAPSAGSQEKE